MSTLFFSLPRKHLRGGMEGTSTRRTCWWERSRTFLLWVVYLLTTRLGGIKQATVPTSELVKNSYFTPLKSPLSLGGSPPLKSPLVKNSYFTPLKSPLSLGGSPPLKSPRTWGGKLLTRGKKKFVLQIWIQKFEKGKTRVKEGKARVQAASWALRRTLPQKTWWPVQWEYRTPCAGIRLRDSAGDGTNTYVSCQDAREYWDRRNWHSWHIRGSLLRQGHGRRRAPLVVCAYFPFHRSSLSSVFDDLSFLTTSHFCNGVALLWKLTCFFASHNTHSWHDLPLFEREIPGR
jgi:hypothetical protein